MNYPKFIGKFPLGYGPVKVFVTNTVGGEGAVNTLGKTPEIRIGLDEDSWSDVLSIALHEAFEVSAMQQGCHFEPSLDLSGDTGKFVFVLTHQQFSQTCANVGLFLAAVTPALAKEYKKFKA